MEEKEPDFILRAATILAVLKKVKRSKLYLNVEELHSAIFLLQNLFNVDLCYEFKTIRYSPSSTGIFSTELQSDTGWSVRGGRIEITETKKEGLRCYRITEEGEETLIYDFHSEYSEVKDSIDKLFDFAGRNPEKLKLYGVIFFLISQGVTKFEELVKQTKAFKPLFKDSVIKKAAGKALLIKVTGIIPVKSRTKTTRTLRIPARILKKRRIDTDILRGEIILTLLERAKEFRGRKYLTEEEIQSAVLIIQEAFRVNLGCRFGKIGYTTYSAGPYSITVHKNLEFFVESKKIAIKRVRKEGNVYYKITEKGEKSISVPLDETILAQKKVNSLLNFTGKNPEKLKLYGTALLLFLNGVRRTEELIKQVKILQPHFKDTDVEKAVTKLLRKFQKRKTQKVQ